MSLVLAHAAGVAAAERVMALRAAEAASPRRLVPSSRVLPSMSSSSLAAVSATRLTGVSALSLHEHCARSASPPRDGDVGGVRVEDAGYVVSREALAGVLAKLSDVRAQAAALSRVQL